MARPLLIPPRQPVEELECLYRRARDPVERSQLHIVWLLVMGEPTSAVVMAAGYSVGRVRNVAAHYRPGGPGAVSDRRGGAGTVRQVAGWVSARIGREADQGE